MQEYKNKLGVLCKAPESYKNRELYKKWRNYVEMAIIVGIGVLMGSLILRWLGIIR